MKNNKFHTLSLIFSCLLLIVSVIGVGKVVLAHEVKGLSLIGAILELVTLIFALYYLVYGFSKNVALLYKISLAFATINALLAIIISSNKDIIDNSVLFCSLCFGLYMVLLFANNLGKEKSLVFSSLILLIRASGFIHSILTFNSITNDSVILVFAQFAIALMILVSNYAKYIDKKQRGTN